MKAWLSSLTKTLIYDKMSHGCSGGNDYCFIMLGYSEKWDREDLTVKSLCSFWHFFPPHCDLQSIYWIFKLIKKARTFQFTICLLLYLCSVSFYTSVGTRAPSQSAHCSPVLSKWKLMNIKVKSNTWSDRQWKEWENELVNWVTFKKHILKD